MNDAQLANYAARVARDVLESADPDEDDLLRLSEVQTEQAERAIQDQRMVEQVYQYALNHPYTFYD